jgi:hypothetical protein
MVFPVATTDFILPAGNANMSQNPAFSDSEELNNTLDVLDQFPNAIPAAKWSIPMYLRPSGTLGSAPQGHILFQCLQHALNAATTASISAEPTAAIATITIKGISGGVLPEKGVVTLAGMVSEKVHYTGITRASRTASTATLTGCVRGYDASTAATHAIEQLVTLSSIFYRQQVAAPSCSIWIETDHFVQACKGCSVDSADFEVSNEGAVKVTFNGQGMQVVYAGTSALSESAVATNTHLHVVDASLYSAGAIIYDSTVGSTRATISAVNATTNVLTLSSAFGSVGATADVIKGYLPTGTEIGDPIESADTTIQIDGVAGAIKNCTFTISAPKKYVEDEVGTDYPEEFMEDARSISSSLSIYFRKAAAKYFSAGKNGEEYTVLLTFGDTAGAIFDIYCKRCKLEVPTIAFAAPAIELNIPLKALGTVGEDSCEIVVR